MNRPARAYKWPANFAGGLKPNVGDQVQAYFDGNLDGRMWHVGTVTKLRNAVGGARGTCYQFSVEVSIDFGGALGEKMHTLPEMEDELRDPSTRARRCM